MVTTQLLAHGIGTRTDLPVPRALALYGAGAAVLISFTALLSFWPRPRLGGRDSGRAVPAALQRVVDAPAVRLSAQAVVLVVAVLLAVVALTGPARTEENLAPWAVYVTFWVGLVPASLLLGPVWGYANPLRLLQRGISAVTGPAPAADRLDRLGLWPAAASLLAFLWLELVYPQRAEPVTVGLFLVAYATVQLVAALRYGEGWFARGDGFEVYSRLLGRLSPWGRTPQGRLVVRNPLTNLRTTPAAPGLAAVVVVLLGSTAFDGLARTAYWQTGPGADDGVLSGTAGLAACVLLVGALYAGAARATGALGKQPARPQPGRYAHSLVPIALGYTVAHYFSLLVIDGQTTWILASNPFGTEGTDLFGTVRNRVDYGVVTPDTIALVQVGAVVVGHVLGVTAAHEQALRSKARGSDQLPLVVAMALFTVVGLGLLFGV